ncbi:HAD-IA family hydrolase [bacterium]|nr:HAD-IA family hydrolase [bacterium]
MAFKLIIFDLDGTIINSLADITDSFNYALAECGRVPFTLTQVKQMIGTGVDNFLKQALGKNTDPAVFIRVHDYFIKHYRTNLSTKTCCYQGIKNMLCTINGNRQITVLSNKNQEFISPILSNLRISDYFSAWLGGDNPYGKKPSPESINYLINKFSVKKEETLIIGDMPVDIKTAKASGVSSCAVLWGYGCNVSIKKLSPDYIISYPREILKIL